jgi:hypothetical protein
VGPHAVGGRLCPWALAVCRHALGRSRWWGVVASVGACVQGVALGVILVGGGLLHLWALAFVGGRHIGGCSCQ